MKIGEYEQMMSYLTRPTTKKETREDFKYGTVPGKGNSKINYDPETDTYRKRVQETIDGKKTNKYIYSDPGQSLEDFKQIKPVRSTGANDATVRARQYIDGWTKNWFDNNLKNYGVKDFDVMIDELSSDWQLELESGNVPEGKKSFNLSTPKLKLPNITTLSDIPKGSNLPPFKYNDVTFYKNLEGTDSLKSKTLAQFKKVFYKNQINTNPQLREGLNKFFDFMSADKRGLYRKLDGKTIKDFMNTEVSDEVKFLLDPEISGLGQASKKEVFNSYPDFADNYNKFTEDKVRLKAVQTETEAMAKAGKKTADQYKKVKADIAKQNDVLAKMSVNDIANNKELLNSVRLSINPKTGEVSYTNYTVNDPKGKPALTDLELAKKIKQKAEDKNFYVTEHIGKKSLNKANLAYPNNIQSANYMSNSQLENARRFLINSENRNTPAAQNLDKALEQTGLTIRGSEYGGQRFGNKIDIVVPASTGRSSLVDSQLLNNKTSSPPTFSSNPMADPSMLKKYGKYALQIAGTPLGTGVLTAGFGVDPTSAIDRTAIAAEAAFAPALVKNAKKVATNPLTQRILNLGLSPQMAMRAARIASPLGIASLGGEALYQYGKFAKDEIEKVKNMSDEERRVYNESLMDEGALIE